MNTMTRTGDARGTSSKTAPTTLPSASADLPARDRLAPGAVGFIAAILWMVSLGAGNEQKPAGEAVPIGSILAFGGPADQISPADEWLVCDGRELASTQYDKLFKAIGYAWGRGQRDNTFHIPDLRGLFLRGVSDGAAEERDPDKATRAPAFEGGNSGDNVGSVQTDEIKHHTHLFAGLPLAAGEGTIGTPQYVRFFATKSPDETQPELYKAVAETGGAETRPRNAYVHWIIKCR